MNKIFMVVISIEFYPIFHAAMYVVLMLSHSMQAPYNGTFKKKTVLN